MRSEKPGLKLLPPFARSATTASAVAHAAKPPLRRTAAPPLVAAMSGATAEVHACGAIVRFRRRASWAARIVGVDQRTWIERTPESWLPKLWLVGHRLPLASTPTAAYTQRGSCGTLTGLSAAHTDSTRKRRRLRGAERNCILTRDHRGLDSRSCYTMPLGNFSAALPLKLCLRTWSMTS
jgi:hypothetical protein